MDDSKKTGSRQTVAGLCLVAALPIAAVAAQLTGADTNKDGRISRAEAKAAQNKSFQRLDSNGNGRIDRKEFDKGQPGLSANADEPDRQRRKRIIKGWFDNIDTNDDDKISRAEYRKAVAPYFDRMDTNDDGSISADELRRVFHGQSGAGQKKR